MATCARCGAATSPDRTACPACGAGRATAPLGSSGETPVRSGTLVLGSGVPLSDPSPAGRRAATPAPSEPAHSRPRAPKPRAPRAPRPPVPSPPKSLRPAAPKARLGWWLSAGGAAVAVAVLLSILVWPRRRLGGEVRFDPAGHAELHLSCPGCSEGTTVSLAGQTASVVAGRALLRLEPPLTLGVRRQNVELRAPGKSPAREQVEYRVDYLVSPDQRGLSQPDPKLAVVFDADDQVTVVVDGRVVEPGPNGARRYELPLRAELTGAAREAMPLAKRVPYVVKLPSGETVRGEVELASNIVPLVVDAPGESIVIEGTSFLLAGRTDRDGLVTVEGRAITVDPSGRFAQLMSVSSVGDTSITVRASAPGRAPRLVPVRVKRVASLAAEATLFEQRAQTSYAAIAEDIEKKLGWAVALEGKVQKLESDGYVSWVLFEVTRGCPRAPCVAFLRLGDKSGLALGMPLGAYGYLAGKRADASSGRELPEVRVEFVRGQK